MLQPVAMELFGANGTSQFLIFNYDKREIVLKAVTTAITAQIGSYIGFVLTLTTTATTRTTTLTSILLLKIV